MYRGAGDFISAGLISLLACGLLFAAGPAVADSPTAGRVSGRVADRQTGGPLVGAAVTVEGLRLGGICDTAGVYSIERVPVGRHRLVARMMGYRDEIVRGIRVVADSIVTVDVALEARPIELETVTVTGRRSPSVQEETRPSVRAIRPGEVRTMAGGGEDLFRAVQALPGVIARADYASQFYVRGGTPDQNLILVDDVAVFNPYRMKMLGGPVSMFNPDVVGYVELMPGGFPAEYGDKLSAVLKVDNREGDRFGHHFHGNVSLIDMRGLAEGPMPLSDGDGTWLVAGRRTYYDLLLNNLDELPEGTVLPYFRDLQGKFVYDLSPTQKLQVNLLDSREGLELKELEVEDDDEDSFFGDDEEFSLTSGVDNRLYSVGWASAISDVTLSELTLSHFTDSWSFGAATEDQDIEFGIDMRKLAIDEDLLHIASRQHSIQAGVSIANEIADITAEVNQDSARYYSDNPDDHRAEDGAIVHREFRFQNASTLSGFYVQDEWKRFAPLFRALVGCRVDRSTFTRETVYSPRLSLTYMLHEALALRGGWGYHYQAPTFVSLFERFERNIEWNLFETITLKTEKSIHYLGGLEWDAGRGYTAKVEGYYKSLDDLVVLTDSTENDVPNNSGSGFASGFELFLQKKPSSQSRLSGWVSYSYSYTKEETPEEQPYFRDFDQRHTLNVVCRLRPTLRTAIDVKYAYGSGFPWTPVEVDEHGDTRFDERGEVVWGETNSRRNPSYRRLDLRLGWERTWGEGRSFLVYLEIINVLNRRNVYEYYWNDDYSSRLVSYMLPSMPFFGIRVEL